MQTGAASALVAALAPKLSKTSSDAAVTLLRSIRTQHGLAEVTAEAAELASRRSLPLVKLPAVLEAEVDALLEEQGVTTREAGRLAADIRDRFKKLSHSPHRGGLTPARSRPDSSGPHNTRLFPRDLRAGSVTPGRQPRLRGAELAAAREALEAGDLGSLSGAQLNAALGLPPPLEQDERLAEILKKIAPSYKSMDQALGYLVARFTPEYAACLRVLQEAAGLMASRAALADAGPAAVAASGATAATAAAGGGAWPPREVLVHGAGTGAAVLAALEALPRGSLESVVAVEESIMRQTLGVRLERRYRQQAAAAAADATSSDGVVGSSGSSDGQAAELPTLGPWSRRHRGASRAALVQAEGRGEAGAGAAGTAAAGAGGGSGGWPRVSWLRSLAPLHKSPGGQRKRYDLVIAPYQLAVLPTLEAKLALVRQLWERCGGALVLVEPGTPAGFGDLAEARELLLALEARRGQQLAAALERGDARAATKLAGAGAHVVAPCPHDGACPLWKAGRRAWCHFEQSLLRPDFMRDTADRRPPGAPPPRRVGARDKQDERFSYLVVRRGPRPQQRVAVARAYAAAAPPPQTLGSLVSGGASGGDAEPGMVAVAAAAAGLRLPQRAVLMQVLINRMAAEPGVGTEASPAGGSDVGVRTQARAPLFGRGSSAAGAGVDEAPGPAAAPAVAAGEGAPAAESATGSTSSRAAGSGSASGSGSGGSSVRDVSPAVADFIRKYPAYGPGLVGRLLALQDAGVDWAAASQAASAPDGEEEEAQQEQEQEKQLQREQLAGPAAQAAAAAGAPTSTDAGSKESSGAGKPSASGAAANHRAGLDAALAHMALSLAPATGMSLEGATLSTQDAEALRAALLQKAAEALGQEEGLDPAASATGELGAGTASSGGNGVGGGDVGGEDGGRMARLSRKDVSDEEYEVAEAQLLQRVYFSLSGVVSSTGTAADDDLDSVHPSRNESDSDSDSDDDTGDSATTANAFKPQLQAAAPPPDLGLALASSYGWGRLLRPPRRRGGHVLLDLCMGPQQQYLYGDVPYPPPLRGNGGGGASGAEVGAEGDTEAAGTLPGRGRQNDEEVHEQQQRQQHQQEKQQQQQCKEEAESTAGRTVQQVVARSARKSWMGAPAYRMARQLGWGDVWPDWFARTHTAREVGPAAAGLRRQHQQDGLHAMKEEESEIVEEIKEDQREDQK